MQWTEDKDELLRKLWGTKPCRVVAIEVGVTKNSLIGRAHRLRLESLQTPSRPKVIRERRVRTYKPKRVRPAGPVEPLNITFNDLASNHCRFPTSGSGELMLSCGHPSIEGSSYCAWHASVAHMTMPPKVFANQRRLWRSAQMKLWGPSVAEEFRPV